MKKLIITCALVSFCSAASMANPVHGFASAATEVTSTPEALAETRAKQYKKDLTLTSEQYTKVYDALLDYYRQDKIAREAGGPGAGQAMQMEMGLDQKIQAAVTASQYATYTRIKGR